MIFPNDLLFLQIFVIYASDLLFTSYLYKLLVISASNLWFLQMVYFYKYLLFMQMIWDLSKRFVIFIKYVLFMQVICYFYKLFVISESVLLFLQDICYFSKWIIFSRYYFCKWFIIFMSYLLFTLFKEPDPLDQYPDKHMVQM